MSVPELEKPQMQFDAKISLGNVLTLLTLVGGFIASYYAMKASIANHEWRLLALEDRVRVQWNTSANISNDINSIKQDVAIIRDRMERVKEKVDERIK